MIGVKKKQTDTGGTTAAAFRERIERAMEEAQNDRSLPMEMQMVLPMIAGFMAQMDDASLLGFRRFLLVLVGDEN